MTQFVDTNIFLRYLTRDDPQKAEACYRLFEKAKNSEVTLTTSESVIAEIVFVLSSPRVYHLTRTEVRARLYPILALEGLKIPDRRKSAMRRRRSGRSWSKGCGPRWNAATLRSCTATIRILTFSRT